MKGPNGAQWTRFSVSNHKSQRILTLLFKRVLGSKMQQQIQNNEKQNKTNNPQNTFGPKTARTTLLSDIFRDFEDFVNVIGKYCGEVRLRVPGHEGAQRSFTNIFRILNVPDLGHTAAGS